jgi:hypothetical protein
MAALLDLLGVAPAERRPVLQEQLELLEGAVRDIPRAPRDLDMALEADIQGIGVAASGGTAERESWALD